MSAEFRGQRETEASRAVPTVKPAWFPDWSGQACAVIASGPSAKKANIAALKGKLKVIAIKEVAFDLCPWADVAYGCDAAWWVHRRGLPDFKGVKVSWAGSVRTQFRDVHLIEIRKDRPGTPGKQWVNEILTDEPGVIGSGDNSAFQALNLAVQFGANRVMLIGLDLAGEHYYGRNSWFRAGNPDKAQFERCRKWFTENAGLLEKLNVDVVNVSPSSTLTCFRRATIEQTVLDWNL